MPSRPLPAERGLAGTPTRNQAPRESLTGEIDPHGPFKDQSERVWEETLLWFWERLTAQIVARLEAAEILPESATGEVKPYAQKAAPPGWAKKLSSMTSNKIGKMGGKQVRELLKELVKQAEPGGWGTTFSLTEIHNMPTGDAKALLLKYVYDVVLPGADVPESIIQEALGSYYQGPGLTPFVTTAQTTAGRVTIPAKPADIPQTWKQVLGDLGSQELAGMNGKEVKQLLKDLKNLGDSDTLPSLSEIHNLPTAEAKKLLLQHYQHATAPGEPPASWLIESVLGKETPVPALFPEAGPTWKQMLTGITPERIAGMTGKQVKQLLKEVLKQAAEEGHTPAVTLTQIHNMPTAEAKKMLLNTALPATVGVYPTFEQEQIALSKVKLEPGVQAGPKKPPKPKFWTKEQVLGKSKAEMIAVLKKSGYTQAEINKLTPTHLVQEVLKVKGRFAQAAKNAVVNVAMGPAKDSQGDLLAEIGPLLQQGAKTGASLTGAEFENMGVRVNWSLVNADAGNWAFYHGSKLIQGIDEHTRKNVAATIGVWIETPGANYQDLETQLQEFILSKHRARLIARTETTRAFAQGSLIMARRGEEVVGFPDGVPLFRYFKTWQTKNDGHVCDACRDLHLNEIEGTHNYFPSLLGPIDVPPAHPGCRCWVTFRPEPIDKAEAEEKVGKKKKSKAQLKKEAEKESAKRKKEAAKKKQAAREAKEKAKQEAEKKKKEDAAAAAKKKKEAEKDAKKQEVAQKVASGEWKPGDGWTDPDATHDALKGKEVAFNEGSRATYSGAVLNGVKLEEVNPLDNYWQTIPDKDVGEPPMPAGQKISTGIIMVEPDGRMWIVAPRNQYGGYQYTYPKGGLKEGLTMQQNAIKEVWEESGLLAEITGFVGDGVGQTSTTRYYLGKRIGGAPWAFQKESEAVHLVDIALGENYVHHARDLKLLGTLMDKLGVSALDVVQDIAPLLERVIDIPESELPEPQPAGQFPESVDGLEYVQSLGGSTGAKLMRDPKTGKLYVHKAGAHAEHVRSEVLADTLYRRLGVKVPDCKLYETPTGPIKLSEYIPNTKSLQDVLSRATSQQREAILAQLKKGWIADAWLGNWDVLGMGLDNILVDDDGTVWRIDNGGALKFRAQGDTDTKVFDAWMTELWSMRTDPQYAQAHRIFGGMKWDEVLKQLEFLGGLPEDELLAGVEGDVKDTLLARLKTARDLWQTSKTMIADDWTLDYLDEFAHASAKLRQSGLLDRAPRNLKFQGQREDVFVYDDNGKLWDKLRGLRGLSSWLSDFINTNGGDYRAINDWASAQGGSSQSGHPRALKHWVKTKRGTGTQGIWENGGASTLERLWREFAAKYGEEKLDKTFTMWHAFNYEFVRNVDFPNNDRENGYLKLMRTEKQSVIDRYKIKQGRVNRAMRGACESSSIFKSVTAYGYEMTLQVVPHHRIMGSYWFEREPGSGNGAFLGDYENEFLFIPTDLPFYYWGRTHDGVSSSHYWTKDILEQLLQELYK